MVIKRGFMINRCFGKLYGGEVFGLERGFIFLYFWNMLIIVYFSSEIDLDIEVFIVYWEFFFLKDWF